jgi:SAM-dependent methyltransferase
MTKEQSDAGYRPVDACRLCGSEHLSLLIDFGDVPLGNNLQDIPGTALSAAAYPLQLNRCSECGHFQLGHAVDPHLLYATNYTYLSGVGKSFVQHFQQNAIWAINKAGLKPGDLVVDVGSNDGTCLKFFQERGLHVCGVDPATLPVSIANENGIATIEAFFNSDAVKAILETHGPAQYVTSHNVLAHVDDLRSTFACVYELLAEDGWFGFEIGYFREVLSNGFFDTIYHEHLDYHHASSLARHLTGLGFDLVELDVTPVQGGSLRLLLKKTGKGLVHDQAEAFLAEEKKSILNDDVFLAGWIKTIKFNMHVFGSMVREATADGRKVVAYGAPTKATLLLRFAGISSADLQYVVEDNELKAGRYLPGSAIPILPTSKLEEDSPDVIVVLAWNFADDILEKLRKSEHLAHSQAIVPLPRVKVEDLC